MSKMMRKMLEQPMCTCPRCGSPIRPFYAENMTGWTCDKCDWWEAVDNYGNAIP